MTVNIHDAKTNFSRLVEMALQGDEVIIARGGKPLLRLSPLEGPGGQKEAGLSRGKINIAEDFDAALPDSIIREFEE